MVKLRLLSEQALAYGAFFRQRGPATIAQAIYRYNRGPVSPQICSAFPNDAAIRKYLGLSGSDKADEKARFRGLYDDWLYWRNSQLLSRANPRYKLYLSPPLPQLPDAFRFAVAEFARSDVPVYKIGGRIEGLVRPDKIVAYFDDFRVLESTALRLLEKLVGFPGQGVPFTCGFDADGLLSWGLDPPPMGRPRRSWRWWIAMQAAHEMCRQPSRVSQGALVLAALRHLRKLGVDTVQWKPIPGLWGKSIEHGL